jgi:trans-aconitate methyltransferase
MELSLYDDSYDRFCDLVEKKNPVILEIGCGPGNITRYLSGRRPDFEIHAIDVAPDMVRLAQRNNPSAHVKVMDCRDLSSLSATYDAIVIGFCIPYLSAEDCRTLISACARLLNRGGILYLSSPESDTDGPGYQAGSDGKNKMYVTRYTEQFLAALLADNFEQEVMKKPYGKKDGTTETHLIFLARKR